MVWGLQPSSAPCPPLLHHGSFGGGSYFSVPLGTAWTREGGGGEGLAQALVALALWLVTSAVGTAKQRLGERLHAQSDRGLAGLAGLPLPSPCSLPNESSHTALELEGEGHSFIYITQEISQSTSINHDHYPKSYKITLLTASAAHWLCFTPFFFPLGKKGENDKIIRSNLGSPK